MKWSLRITSTDSTPGRRATRRRISRPIPPANFAGHSGEVRWKRTVTRPPSTSTPSSRPRSAIEVRTSGSLTAPATLRTRSGSTAGALTTAPPSPGLGPGQASLGRGLGGEVLVAALRELVLGDRVELGRGVDAVEPGDVAADDLVLDLRGQVDAVLLLEVLRELEVHEHFELPVRVPDREVGAVDDPVGPEPEEHVGHDLREPARAVGDEGEHHRQAGVDVRAAGRDPAELLDPGRAAVVDDQVHLRIQPGRLVDVAD